MKPPTTLGWLSLLILAGLALLFEPIRSGFTLANQACETSTDWQRAFASVFNLRHILSFGLLFLVAAVTLRNNRILKAAIGVLLFSAFLEFEQSFFLTGHCRVRDMIPNILGVGLAAIAFWVGSRFSHTPPQNTEVDSNR